MSSIKSIIVASNETFSNVSMSRGYGEGQAFTLNIVPQVSTNFLRKIRITNCTIDSYARGILFDSDTSHELQSP